MCHVESNKKCDFVFEFSSAFWNWIHFWPRKFSLNFRKLFILSKFIFCLVNWTYVPRRIGQKVWFFGSFWIFIYVLEFNPFLHFWPRRFSLIFGKLFMPSIFIFCPVKWTYVTRIIRTKSMGLSISLNFSLYVLELNTFLASQIFTKLQKIVYSIDIDILPCTLRFKKKQQVFFEGFFQMRISQWFSSQISEVNTSFCSEKTEF